MQIKQKTYQSRRDFKAIYRCEHCEHETKEASWGYDDANFHENVIPAMVCDECGKTSEAPSSRPDVPAGVVL